MFNSWWARDQGKARGWRHRKRERVIKDGKSQRQLYPDGGWWDWSLSFWWEGGILLRCHKDLSRMTCNALCILITHYELVMTHWRSKLWAEQVCILLVALLTCPGISASLFFLATMSVTSGSHLWAKPCKTACLPCIWTLKVKNRCLFSAPFWSSRNILHAVMMLNILNLLWQEKPLTAWSPNIFAMMLPVEYRYTCPGFSLAR